METIYTGLLAGFIVGVICVAYVLVRAATIGDALLAESEDEKDSISNHWLIMGVLSSASVIWGFIAAGVYHLLQNYLLFFVFSLLVSVLISLYLYLKSTRYKADKIVLNLIILNGLGFLIPYMYP